MSAVRSAAGGSGTGTGSAAWFRYRSSGSSMVTRVSAGTDLVSHALPPMTAPRPMVTLPRMVAPFTAQDPIPLSPTARSPGTLPPKAAPFTAGNPMPLSLAAQSPEISAWADEQDLAAVGYTIPTAA